MRNLVSSIIEGANHGLGTGSLLGLLHVAILATSGLYATAAPSEVLVSLACYAGLLGLAGGLLGLLVGAISAPFRGRLLPSRPSASGFALVGLYILGWVGFFSAEALGRRTAVLIAVLVALLFLGLFIGLMRALAKREAPRASRDTGRMPIGGVTILLMVDLVLFLGPALIEHRQIPSMDTAVLEGHRLDPLRERAAARFSGKRWNLLLLTVDTLRADHLGCYGYPRETSPAIDALAQTGVRFDHALCQRPKTSPSFATILTGTYPARHGIHRCMQLLKGSNLTLAEILANAGWRTAAVVTNGNLYPEFGFDQGFETYTYGHKGAGEGTDLALAWLKEHGSSKQPWFLWIHHTDPHTPYNPPHPYDSFFKHGEHPQSRHERAIDLYDGEIRYTDDQLRRVLEWLEIEGPLERTLVIFTADHGESLGEHGYFYEHGLHPYEPSGRVPLIFWAFGVIPAGEVSPAVVGLVDLVPTVLDALGVAAPTALQGRSILPVVVDQVEIGPRDFVFLEAGYGPHVGPGRTRALRRTDTKYVQRLTGWARRPKNLAAFVWSMNAWLEGGLAPDELYDLSPTGPGETVNLLKQQPDLAKCELRTIEAFVAQLGGERLEGTTPDSIDFSPETLESLKALGYIN
ncbi:MAG: sulfatase [Candidatus Eisenbacteria sp.]|nr:sulfatase [Candidatus Eisenbacteria bacterium]